VESGGDIRWGELGEEARRAMSWAAAMEVEDVGTRTLLAGMIRAEGSVGAPQQLLDAFDCSRERLFSLLQDMAPRPLVNPHVSEPAVLSGMPPLSPNAERVVEGALSTRDSYEPDWPVDSRHLFAAILDNERCTAYRALEVVLRDKIDLPTVRELFHEYLRSGETSPFGTRLRALAPVASPPPPPPPSPRRELSGHAGAVRALSFAADSGSLASAGADGELRVWDLEGEERPIVLSRDVPQSALAFAPHERRLVCGGDDGEVLFWSLDTPAPEKPSTIAWGNAAVTAVTFSPDGMVAIGDRGGRVTISWSTPSVVGDSLEREAPATGDLSALAFSPAGDRLASAGAGIVVLWVPRTMEALAVVEMEGLSPLALAFASEDRILIHDRDGRTWRWDLDGEEQIEPVAQHSVGSTAAAFSADGSRLAVAGTDGIVRSGPAEGEDGWRVLGSLAAVRSLAFAPDGETVAAGGDYGEIRLWDGNGTGPRPSSGAEWLSDRPTSSDSFGRKRLAAALARRLERINAEEDGGSFLLHVDGPWGVGKSSLLGLLEDDLMEGERAGRGEWLVVHFDAWRQSRVGPPWWALLTSLREELGQSRRLPGRLWLRTLELLKLLRGYLLSSLLSLIVVGLAVALFLLLGPAEGDFAALVQTTSAVIAVATTIWLLGRGAARALMWESASGARLYEQAEQDPMRGLAEHFAWLLAQAGERQVVFFVDDLDRCDESYVVDLLESIQTLVRDAPQRARRSGQRDGHPPFFVVAADGRWIRRSYEHSYETFQDAVQEPGRRLGYLFLDKIFQLTLRVPEIGEEQRTRYLDELLRLPSACSPQDLAAGNGVDADEGAALIQQSHDQEEILQVVGAARPEARQRLEEAAVERLNHAAVERATEHELQRFASLLEPNPRSMKRFVNAYSIALSTELIAGRLPDPDPLALWTILRMRWPELADCLSESPELVTSIAADGGVPDGLPEALVPLCGDAALTALLAFKGGALDAKAIEGLR
jgi:WD40 repeat protein